MNPRVCRAIAVERRGLVRAAASFSGGTALQIEVGIS
ncbi:uncharacterized protein SOCE836_099080 [Sorangium cellulosum]|uniref:Uncharacterized protein n=1 Tax=Sorangium cellulosum TaxID=56 RepID=A0A4P2R4K2_SORCE|nr:uncharacterized protein SOCE836_099080 [Sorangium cellulosum]WCQ96967.1 hypothetical protein NQZ70_09757 [Sorangium sp. Soce836]